MARDIVQLQKEWYKRLKEDGFEDAERFIPYHETVSKYGVPYNRTRYEHTTLRTTSVPQSLRGLSPQDAQDALAARQEQYALGRARLRRLVLSKSDIRHVAVCAYHAEGVSERDIARCVGLGRWSVRKLIETPPGVAFPLREKRLEVNPRLAPGGEK